jgi:hypothetical protein
VVHSLLAGGDSLDDVEVLRAGATASVLGHRVMAASTIGRSCARSAPGHGAGGELVFRADAGFWSAPVIDRLRAHDARFSITVRQTKPVRAVIAAIPEATWTTIPYPDSSVAQVAQTPFRGDRMVVRRTRHHTDQGQLFPTWSCHAFVTDRPGSPVELDADHRRHAVIELAIRDAKHGTGLCPAGLPARRAGGCCICPPAGHKHTRSPWRWPGCAASRALAADHHPTRAAPGPPLASVSLPAPSARRADRHTPIPTSARAHTHTHPPPPHHHSGTSLRSAAPGNAQPAVTKPRSVDSG